MNGLKKGSIAVVGAAEASARRDRVNVHPAWFWGTAAVAVIGAGATVFSALDTRGIHDRFARDPSDADLAARGHDAQVRTNVFLGGTIAASLASATLAYFVFRPTSGGKP